jgi:hypothetical protein
MCIASLVSVHTAGHPVARSGFGSAGGRKALSRTVPQAGVDRGLGVSLWPGNVAGLAWLLPQRHGRALGGLFCPRCEQMPSFAAQFIAA